MAIIRQEKLFNWEDVEIASDMDPLPLVIDAVRKCLDTSSARGPSADSG